MSPSARDVGAAAQLDRIVAVLAAAHRQHAHFVAIFLAEQRHRARLDGVVGVISRVATGCCSGSAAFTSASIAAISSAVIGLGCEKSKRKWSSATSLPFCVTCSPSRWRSAAWSKWVALMVGADPVAALGIDPRWTVSPTATAPFATLP